MAAVERASPGKKLQSAKFKIAAVAALKKGLTERHPNSPTQQRLATTDVLSMKKTELSASVSLPGSDEPGETLSFGTPLAAEAPPTADGSPGSDEQLSVSMVSAASSDGWSPLGGSAPSNVDDRKRLSEALSSRLKNSPELAAAESLSVSRSGPPRAGLFFRRTSPQASPKALPQELSPQASPQAWPKPLLRHAGRIAAAGSRDSSSSSDSFGF